MLTSPNAKRVRAAMRRMETAQSKLNRARTDRDAGVADLHYIDGLTAPNIAREFGLSKSNVVRIIELNRPR